jgi:hypothetical protein
VALQALHLQHGRSLSVETEGDADLVELRSTDGLLELRLKCTPEGVTLQLEGTRISLRASESVDVECGTFNVRAHDGANVQSAGDVRVRGAMIHLN